MEDNISKTVIHTLGETSIYEPNALTMRNYAAIQFAGSFIQGGRHADPQEIIELSIMMSDKIIEELAKKSK